MKLVLFILLIIYSLNTYSQIRGFDILMYLSKMQNNNISYINDSPYKTKNKELPIEYFSNTFTSTKVLLDSLIVNQLEECSETINNNVLSRLNSKEINFEAISKNLRNEDSLYENKLRLISGFNNEISFEKLLDTLFHLNIYDSIHKILNNQSSIFLNNQRPEFFIYINKLYIINNEIILLHYYKHLPKNLLKFFKSGCLLLKYDTGINGYYLLAFEESWHR